jgi:ubiquinone/menaquinone biosynthesis C-methylase UbiE
MSTAQQTLTFSDSLVAREYARHRGEVDEDFIDELVGYLGSAFRILDVGAGVGGPAAALIRRGFVVAAVEPSEAMVRAGDWRHPDVPFVQGFGEELPLRDGTMDAATLLYVLHHVLDPAAVLRETARVLRPDGRIVVVSGRSDSKRSKFFRRYFPTLAPSMPDAYEVGEWSMRAGLHVREVGRAVHWMYRSRTIDAEYLDMVENEMFSILRMLNEDEFEDGLGRLRRDMGKQLPAPEVTVTVLQRP